MVAEDLVITLVIVILIVIAILSMIISILFMTSIVHTVDVKVALIT